MLEPALQATALRYAAGDLTPAEAGAFEERLADDQAARDALSEAVRLSAAALGQKPPCPHPAFRAVLRARLGWERYRRRPIAWAGTGVAAVAVCALVGLALVDRTDPPARAAEPSAPSAHLTEPLPAPDEFEAGLAPHETAPVAFEQPAPACGSEPHRSVAEIWADLSTSEHVEKARDDELRWRQKMRDFTHPAVASRADAP